MTPIKDKIEELFTDRPPGKIYLIMNYVYRYINIYI